ncbi:type II toxin-antitoxin system Phd/YefM family antitoxin [Rickettsia sp. TH2014]|nr:type II toxin-antitoxin system prevent-host-death family antitoxin [Rickettsia sp. TH2014]
MQIVNIHNAKTHLSELIKLAANGKEVIICKSGKPTVKLV